MNNNHDDVLVVEDDPEINELVGAYVKIAGFSYRRAYNGADAIQAATRGGLALIVLDVMLPDFDGFEVCRRLKSCDDTSGIPVVMLTAMNRENTRRRSQECGAVECLTKPFDPDRLMSTIRRRADGAHAAPT